jgi:transcriptional regulator with XRE-family HTH domain
MSLGSKLYDLRAKKGESLQQAADNIGITKTHIWELEKGKSSNPSAELLKKISDYYKVTIDFLIDPNQSEPGLNDEAMVFYRDLKSLDQKDQEVILNVMKTLRGKGT